jgi:hypothetical protein
VETETLAVEEKAKANKAVEKASKSVNLFEQKYGKEAAMALVEQVVQNDETSGEKLLEKVFTECSLNVH